MNDLKDELERERREKEWAETWKPSGPGDALIGTLEGYDEATTDFGTYTVAHIRNEDGVLKGVWLMHSVLQDEWEEAAPEKGDRVGAMYHGKRSGDSYDYSIGMSARRACKTRSFRDGIHGPFSSNEVSMNRC